MPLFLEYHRNLGIGCFVFVDNDSLDGSLDKGSKTLAKHEIIGSEPSVVFTSNTAHFRTKMGP